MQCKRGFQTGSVAEPHSAGKQVALSGTVRYGVGLQAVLHLQDVLDLPQKGIGLSQLGQFSVKQKATVAKARKAYQCMRRTKPAVFAAVSQLKGLGDEFDLPYSADAEFYVLPL